MKISRKTLPFIGVIFFAFIVLLFSIWDIIYDEQWLERIISLYGILIILTLLFLVSNRTKKPIVIENVDEFEKSFKEKLHHFKCSSCGGIFAIKKSTHNNKKPFSLTCPDCGTTGIISLKSSEIIEKILE
jgi:predicted RNA-binding Zn-ribbon protein involved in translation (DUF1610 family)